MTYELRAGRESDTRVAAEPQMDVSMAKGGASSPALPLAGTGSDDLAAAIGRLRTVRQDMRIRVGYFSTRISLLGLPRKTSWLEAEKG